MVKRPKVKARKTWTFDECVKASASKLSKFENANVSEGSGHPLWIYIECQRCNYDNTFGKLGIKRSRVQWDMIILKRLLSRCRCLSCKALLYGSRVYGYSHKSGLFVNRGTCVNASEDDCGVYDFGSVMKSKSVKDNLNEDKGALLSEGASKLYQNNDVVEFTSGSGQKFRAVVVRVNRKTLTLRDGNGQRWRVAYERVNKL